jgi:hypothetical protein
VHQLWAVTLRRPSVVTDSCKRDQPTLFQTFVIDVSCGTTDGSEIAAGKTQHKQKNAKFLRIRRGFAPVTRCILPIHCVTSAMLNEVL